MKKNIYFVSSKDIIKDKKDAIYINVDVSKHYKKMDTKLNNNISNKKQSLLTLKNSFPTLYLVSF